MTAKKTTPRVTATHKVLDELKNAGRAGRMLEDMADALGMTDAHVNLVMSRLAKMGGKVEYRLEDHDDRPLKRWYLYGNGPSRRAGALTENVAQPRRGTLSNPFDVQWQGRVVDASECRPWAAAMTEARHAQ